MNKRSIKRASHFLKQYFIFSRNERKGIYALLLVLLLTALLPQAYSKLFPPPLLPVQLTFPDTIAHTFITETPAADVVTLPVYAPFVFDPNTADSSTLLKLGFKAYAIRNMLSYRRHGGRFKQGTDLLRVYGADSTHILQLLPYIQVAPTPEIKHETFAHTTYERKPLVAVEVNTADSAALVGLYGIGPAMASRIITYRNRLGGFMSRQQLTEVYGVTPELLEQLGERLVVDPQQVKLLNLNTADEQTLKQHPYLRWKMAAAIVNYRKQHGAFKTPEALRQVLVIPDTTFQKLRPYLLVE